jgi:hypothetical protein
MSYRLSVLLLMPVLTQTLFTFVCSHLMSLTLLSAWHFPNILWENLFNVCLNLIYKGFCRFKRRDIMGRNDKGSVF